jgi:hypothetical protein
MRRDAALYEAAPPPTGKRGRPRTKGERLATPAETAAALGDTAFTKEGVDWRGSGKDILVWSHPVLWYTVDKTRLVLPVIVRDPAHIMRDDFFFTTDLNTNPADVAADYAGRWSISACAPKTRSAGNTKDPNALHHCRCGSTQRSGPGTSRRTGQNPHGHHAPGTRRKPPQASSTPSQHCDENSGPNELRHCHPPNRFPRKSSTTYSTPSPPRHRPGTNKTSLSQATTTKLRNSTVRNQRLKLLKVRIDLVPDAGIATTPTPGVGQTGPPGSPPTVADP